MKFNSVTYKGLHTAIPPGTGPSMRYACVTVSVTSGLTGGQTRELAKCSGTFTADLSAMGAITEKNFLPALSIFNKRNSLL